MAAFTLADLDAIVARRAAAPLGESYTATLLAGAPLRTAKKLGEEAVELALALQHGDRSAIVAEAADVLYHLLVALRGADVPLAAVLEELARRTAQSGHAEKAQRTG